MKERKTKNDIKKAISKRNFAEEQQNGN